MDVGAVTPGRGVALVTGAARGIGAAVAERLAGDGYAAACVDLDLEGAERVAARLDGTVPAAAFRCDVSSVGDVARLRDEVDERLGRVTLLVNVAGLFFRHRVPDLAEEDWDRILGVNLKGPFLTCRAFLPAMTEAGSGCIVNIASTAGIRGGRDRAAYCAAKGGLVQLTRSLALDHGAEGVRVNCVCPGLIDTAMADWIRADQPALQEWEGTLPAGRMGSPAEVAGVVSFLASPEAAYLHGAVVVADGGATV